LGTICKTVCPILSDRCLSVTLVYCGQTVGWIKMKLVKEVGLGPGHIVLDGDPAPSPQKGAQLPIFGSCLLWPNSWMDEDATSRRQPNCVPCGPSPPPQKKVKTPATFGPCLLWPNGCSSQLLLSTCLNKYTNSYIQ